MSKYHITTSLLLLSAVLSAEAARLTQSEKAIIKQHTQLCDKQTFINQKAGLELSKWMSYIDKYTHAIAILKKGDKSRIDSRIRNYERNNKSTENSLKSYKRNFEDYKKRFAAMKQDKQKQLEANQLTAQEKALNNKIIVMRKPFQDRHNKKFAKIDLEKKNEELKKEKNEALRTLRNERNKVSQKLFALKKAGYRSTASTAAFVRSYQNAKYNYERYKADIVIVDQLIQLLKSPVAQRGKAIAELEQKIASDKNKVLDYCMKVNQQKAKFTRNSNFDILNQRYQTAAAKFVRVPRSKEFALVNRYDLNSWFGIAQIECRWFYDIATPHIPYFQPAFRGSIYYQANFLSSNYGLIDNKYRIVHLNNYVITARVGKFNVGLSTDNRLIYKKDILIKALKALYDLDAIADASK